MSGAADGQQVESFYDAIGGLPTITKIVERFYLRDESYRAIGNELGLRDGTVASRLSRALERLQGLLGRNELPQPSSSTSPSY